MHFLQFGRRYKSNTWLLIFLLILQQLCFIFLCSATGTPAYITNTAGLCNNVSSELFLIIFTVQLLIYQLSTAGKLATDILTFAHQCGELLGFFLALFLLLSWLTSHLPGFEWPPTGKVHHTPSDLQRILARCAPLLKRAWDAQSDNQHGAPKWMAIYYAPLFPTQGCLQKHPSDLQPDFALRFLYINGTAVENMDLERTMLHMKNSLNSLLYCRKKKIQQEGPLFFSYRHVIHLKIIPTEV